MKKKIELTSKASLFLGIDLIARQSAIVHLHTGNSSSEIPPVANASSHSHGVVCCQPNSSNAFLRHEPRVHEQTRHAGSVAVCCTNKLPSMGCDSSTYNRFGEAASSTTREPYK